MTGARQNRLRALKPENLESVIEIDRRITGPSRAGGFSNGRTPVIDGTAAIAGHYRSRRRG